MSNHVNGQTGTTVTGLTAGTYSLQVIDNNGCSFTRTTTLNGTTLFTGYEIYNVCADKFRNTGVSGRRGVLQMFNEGYFDLTSGDTGCILVATVNTAIPPSATIVLPPAFDMAPAIGVKIIDGVGCEKFMILNCVDLPPKGKQFQDGDYFYFMNYDIYQFQ